jgi:hypothetical protein
MHDHKYSEYEELQQITDTSSATCILVFVLEKYIVLVCYSLVEASALTHCGCYSVNFIKNCKSIFDFTVE